MRSIALTGKLFMAGLMAVGIIHIATSVTVYALSNDKGYAVEQGG